MAKIYVAEVNKIELVGTMSGDTWDWVSHVVKTSDGKEYFSSEENALRTIAEQYPNNFTLSDEGKVVKVAERNFSYSIREYHIPSPEEIF